MKVRIGRDELLTGLQRVQGVVEKRNTMPILSNILLEVKQDGAEIIATALEIGMRGLYKATVLEPGGVLVLLGDQLSTAYQAAQLAQGNFAPTSVTVSDLFAGAIVPGFTLGAGPS